VSPNIYCLIASDGIISHKSSVVHYFVKDCRRKEKGRSQELLSERTN
jgi:hypothetical protein